MSDKNKESVDALIKYARENIGYDIRIIAGNEVSDEVIEHLKRFDNVTVVKTCRESKPEKVRGCQRVFGYGPRNKWGELK